MSEHLAPSQATQNAKLALAAKRPLDQGGLGGGRPTLGSAPLFSAGYSNFISVVKILLPIVALALVSLVVFWPHLRPIDNAFRIGFADIDMGADEKPSLQNARFFGADEKQQPYSVSSDLVMPVGADETQYDLEKPKADIALEDGTWLVLTARTGRFDKTSASLVLNGDVNLFHDMGYEFHTQTATVDMNLGTATGNDPVNGQGPFGELEAEGFRLMDRGKRIEFTGQSRLILYPGFGGAS